MLVGRTDEDLEAPRPDVAHTLLQLPLNWLGAKLVERAFDAGEPADLDPRRVRAFGTFLLGDETLPEWFWPWCARQSPQLRVLHLGSLLPLSKPDGGRRLTAWLQRFGLGYDDRQVADPSRIGVDWLKPGAYPFESRPVYERLYGGPWNLDAANEAWLVVRDAQSPRRPRTPIVTGRWGGIALQPWLLRIGGEARDRRWYADPFVLLRDALGLAGVPAPDPNVRNGRRVFVLHVDGDGFESRSSVVPGQLCGEVFRDRVVQRYRVPMTISFIVASLTDTIAPTEPTPRMTLARTLLEPAWVEPASHSVLHPLNWRRDLDRRSLPRSVVWYEKLGGYRHDMVAEVRDSIAFVDRWLAPVGRPCRVMLWSGAANPTAEAIAAATAAGCENLNGGLFRWDDLNDSVGFVSPWGKRIGDQWQVFAGAANENEFPGFFTTMPGVFAHIDTTIERTGSPRILKPANVYVHFYSAENQARLDALDGLLQRWIEREETIPTFASSWSAAVRDAQFGCRVVPTPRGFHFVGFDQCRTVRIDGDTSPIDWANCTEVVGARRIGGSLYLHLGAAEAEVAFSTTPTAATWLHVEQADCELEGVVTGPRQLRCRVLGCGARTLVVAGMPPAVAVRWSDGSGGGAMATDERGRCVLHWPAGDAAEVRVWLP